MHNIEPSDDDLLVFARNAAQSGKGFTLGPLTREEHTEALAICEAARDYFDREFHIRIGSHESTETVEETRSRLGLLSEENKPESRVVKDTFRGYVGSFLSQGEEGRCFDKMVLDLESNGYIVTIYDPILYLHWIGKLFDIEVPE